MNKKNLMTLAAIALAASSAANAGNLIVNGEFDQGLTGFSSSYALGGSSFDPGVLNIGTNPTQAHQYWANFTSDNMLLVNGGMNAQANTVWAQTVTLTQGMSYTFSASATSVYHDNPALLQAVLSIGGVDYNLGSAQQLSADAGIWQTWTGTVTSPFGGEVILKLLDLNTQYQGNDFAIDKLSLVSAVPEPSSYALLLAGLGAMGFVSRRRKQA